MTPVRLEPAAPRSGVRHSTTGPLRALTLNSHRGIRQVISLIAQFPGMLAIPPLDKDIDRCTLHLSMFNIARSELSSHTHDGSHQRLYHFQRKDKIVKDFIILNQVVSEKT